MPLQSNGASPRQIAHAYLKARTKEQRAEAVKGCPVEWRELVNTHVRIALEKAKKKEVQNLQGLVPARATDTGSVLG